MKKTPWFPKSIKPHHIGWYEVKGCTGFQDCAGMHWWSGTQWMYGWGEGEFYVRIPHKPLPWRGLVK